MSGAVARRPRKFVAGNWKMYGVANSLNEARDVAAALAAEPSAARVALFPPATLIHRMADMLQGTAVEVGGQDIHTDGGGAYTGDVSAEMLRDAGASLVILGHSERRSAHRETNEMIAAKVEQALKAGLEPIVCVGESSEQRNAGLATEVVGAQLLGSLPDVLKGRPFSVAYEPIWAIGSGVTPTMDEIGAVHAEIRKLLTERFGEQGETTSILYGGSVKPSNAVEIMGRREVEGALVGGASLKAADFLPIIRAAG